jgi:predicted transcriptional regulator of viral defense system
MGEAGEVAMRDTRRAILEAVRQHDRLTPRGTAEATELEPGLVRRTMSRMAKDGQLRATEGWYEAP